MKTFLAVFTGSPDGEAMCAWAALDEAQRQARMQEGIAAWQAWMGRHADRIEHAGGPLGRTKRIDGAGVADTRNALCGFVVLRAESHEEAAALFVGHPHFAMMPGEGVEVMECLPTPGR